MTSRGLLYAAILLPFWLAGSAMIWMFLGFGFGIDAYSSGTWWFINNVVPVLLVLLYLPAAWWVVRRESK